MGAQLQRRDLVPAGPVRDHIARLCNSGMTTPQISRIAQVSVYVIRGVVSGSGASRPWQRVERQGAERILAVPVPEGTPKRAAAYGWRNKAACLTEDPERFFPISDDAFAMDPEVVKICEGCPVRADCARFADSIAAAGVWAGFLLPEETAEFAAYRTSVDKSEYPCIECGATIEHDGQLWQSKCADCRNRMVDTALVLVHIYALTQRGRNHKQIGELAGVNRRTVSRIIRDRPLKVSARVAEKILAVPLREAAHA